MLQLGSIDDPKGSKKISAISGDAQSVSANRLSEMTAAVKEGRGKTTGQAAAKTVSRSAAADVSGADKTKKKGAVDSAPENAGSLTEVFLRGNKLRALDGLQALGTVSHRCRRRPSYC